jgi:hypothetical protein
MHSVHCAPLLSRYRKTQYFLKHCALKHFFNDQRNKICAPIPDPMTMQSRFVGTFSGVKPCRRIFSCSSCVRGCIFLISEDLLRTDFILLPCNMPKKTAQPAPAAQTARACIVMFLYVGWRWFRSFKHLTESRGNKPRTSLAQSVGALTSYTCTATIWTGPPVITTGLGYWGVSFFYSIFRMKLSVSWSISWKSLLLAF